jgi:hypothetical protein
MQAAITCLATARRSDNQVVGISGLAELVGDSEPRAEIAPHRVAVEPRPKPSKAICFGDLEARRPRQSSHWDELQRAE